jgi:hypothetical protein
MQVEAKAEPTAGAEAPAIEVDTSDDKRRYGYKAHHRMKGIPLTYPSSVTDAE